MTILLLDDDVNFIGQFKKMVSSIDSSLNIIAFDNEDSFVEYLYNNHKTIDAVIFDIELKIINGIDLAVSVHDTYPNIPVVFVTGYPEKYCQNIFLGNTSLKPFAFITKPLELEIVQKVMGQLLEVKAAKKSTLMIKTSLKSYIVEVDDIIFIESNRRLILYHTKDETLKAYDKLKDVLTRLPDFFLMPHTSFLVNCKHIKSFDSTTITLKDGQTIPISRGMKNEFTDKIIHLKGLSKC